MSKGKRTIAPREGTAATIVTGGGMDRAWRAPLTHDGQIDTDNPDYDNIGGSHQGAFEYLNVANMQPGFEYIHERNTRADRLRIRRNGGQAVQGDDPEHSAMDSIMGLDDGLGPTSLDSTNENAELILVRYPAEAVRRKREAELAKANAWRRGGAASFADNVGALERQLSDGRPSRFRRADHSIDMQDANSMLVDQIVPDEGILPTG